MYSILHKNLQQIHITGIVGRDYCLPCHTTLTNKFAFLESYQQNYKLKEFDMLSSNSWYKSGYFCSSPNVIRSTTQGMTLWNCLSSTKVLTIYTFIETSKCAKVINQEFFQFPLFDIPYCLELWPRGPRPIFEC